MCEQTALKGSKANVHRHEKKCPGSLAIWKMWTQITPRHIRMAVIQTSKDNKCKWKRREKAPKYLVGGDVTNHYGERHGNPSESNIVTSWDSVIIYNPCLYFCRMMVFLLSTHWVPYLVEDQACDSKQTEYLLLQKSKKKRKGERRRDEGWQVALCAQKHTCEIHGICSLSHCLKTSTVWKP